MANDFINFIFKLTEIENPHYYMIGLITFMVIFVFVVERIKQKRRQIKLIEQAKREREYQIEMMAEAHRRANKDINNNVIGSNNVIINGDNNKIR